MNMNACKTSRVWRINGKILVVADTIADAIDVWKAYYEDAEEPSKVEAVECGFGSSASERALVSPRLSSESNPKG